MSYEIQSHNYEIKNNNLDKSHYIKGVNDELQSNNYDIKSIHDKIFIIMISKE